MDNTKSIRFVEPKKKNQKKYDTVRTVPKSKRQILDRELSKFISLSPVIIMSKLRFKTLTFKLYQ